MPIVSFVTPAYNASQFIATTIRSVQSQSVTDWEMIIVDDCSTDNTAEIAEKFAVSDSRIRVIRRNSPSGSAFTPRLEAIKAATSSLISPLDADDAIYPDYLERLLEDKRHSDSQLVYPLLSIWNGNPECSPSELRPALSPDSPQLGKKMVGREMLKLTLDGWNVTCNGGLIPRSLYMEAFRRIGEYHPDINADETLSRWLIFLSETALFSPTPYLYRENPDSLTHNITIRRLDILQSHVEVNEMVRDNYGKESEEYRLSQRQLFHSVFNSLVIISDPRFNPEDLSEGRRKISETLQQIDFNCIRGNVSNILYAMARLPFPLLEQAVRLRSKVKSGLTTAKFQLSRPGRKWRHIKETIVGRNHFNSNLSLLRKGILPPDSESAQLYSKYYTDAYEEDASGHTFQDATKSGSTGHKKSGGGGIEMIICPFDGRIVHGGATDRIRGILSTYTEAKRRNIPLRIIWTDPFRLEDYLQPARIDWRIDPKEMSYQRGEATPIVIQDYNNRESDLILRGALESFNGQLHVYSNADSAIGHYKELYRELFRPSDALQRASERHSRILGKEYYAFTFRFAQLLGDFADTPNSVLPPAEQTALIEKVASEFHKIASALPSDCRIFLTGDSRRFLDYMKNRDERIYIVEGDIRHVDHKGIASINGRQADSTIDAEDISLNQPITDAATTSSGHGDSDEDVWMKMFVDQQLLMGAKKIWRMTTGGMYPSGFPRFAAEVGGVEFIDHRF